MQQAILFFIVIAFLAGVAAPIQAAINARLGSALDSTLWAVVVSYGVGTIVLLVLQAFRRAPLPVGGDGAAFPFWIWCGGAVGAFFVVSVTSAAPKLGVGSMVALVIAGQVCCSLVIDHFGLIGMPKQAVSLEKLLGALVVATGAAFVVTR